jgi:hypothetical protein
MKKPSFILFVLSLLLLSCSNDDPAQEQDAAKLDKMYQEIVTLSGVDSQTCTDPKEWAITPIASKACGGVGSYIVYSKKINTDAFLKKVQKFTDSYAAYNKKWNLFSTCDISIPPTSVKCTNGKAELSYEHVLF